MALTNYPNGLSSFGIPQIGAGPTFTTGNVWFVDSTFTGAGGDGTSPDKPLATLNLAVAKCRANKADLIILMPGHTENVIAAAGTNINVAGVRVIGIGNGSNRPTFNMTTVVGASFEITAANVYLENVLFTGGLDNLTYMVNVTAADVTLRNIETRDVTGEMAVGIRCVTSPRLMIDGWRHDGATNAGSASALVIIGGDRITVQNFVIDGNFSAAAIEVRTIATTDLEIHDGWIRTRNAADLCIRDLVTASTGLIGPNLSFRLQDDAANITEAITGATFVQFLPINVVNAAGEVAMPINTVASTDV